MGARRAVQDGDGDRLPRHRERAARRDDRGRGRGRDGSRTIALQRRWWNELQLGGAAQYRNGGFRQVFVAGDRLGANHYGDKARLSSTILKWIFDEPTLHASRGEAFYKAFGRLGQLGCLAHYGPPIISTSTSCRPAFARIDLGCDGTRLQPP
jgi:hypothetical protein